MSEDGHKGVCRRRRAHLVLHGAIVLFLGLFAGAPYDLALSRGWGVEPVRAWVLAHSAGVMCGVMALSVAAVMPRLRLGNRAAAVMVWCFVASIYGFTLGMWTAGFTSARGIMPSRSPADLIVNICYQVGAWGALAGGLVLISGAAAALRSIPRCQS